MSQGIANPTPLSGLTAAEVAQRVARGEINRVRRSDRADYLDIVARNFFTLFNALVVPAALALFLLGEYRDAFAVSGMALTNLVLGLVQEIRAKRHLDRLTLLAETRVRVLRDGQVQQIPAGDVVRDDVLLLAAGDTVVADGTVLESRFLEVDEALLTGESDPVPRQPGEPLLSGSFCVAGEGSYRAETRRRGVFRAAHRPARRVPIATPPAPSRSASTASSPVLTADGRRPLSRLRRAVRVWRDVSLDDLVEMIAATITSMVPQGLVLMATLGLRPGAVRMSRRGALVQRLNAVESMASIDTLCMDKTGTLTTNQLHLEKVLRPGRVAAGRGDPRTGCVCSPPRRWIAPARASPPCASPGETQADLLDQLPFKSQNRYSAVRVRSGREEHVLVLGACEALQPGPPATGSDRKRFLTTFVVGTCVCCCSPRPSIAPREKFAGSLEGFVLRPLALVALGDELRPEARRVLEELASQGIRFKILSGDHADTGRATIVPLADGTNAAAVKALAETPVVSGDELQAAAEPAELIRTRCVVRPRLTGAEAGNRRCSEKTGTPCRHDRRRRQRRAANQERPSGHRHGRRRRRQQDRCWHRAGDEQLRSPAGNTRRRPHHRPQPPPRRQGVPGQERLHAGSDRRRWACWVCRFPICRAR